MKLGIKEREEDKEVKRIKVKSRKENVDVSPTDKEVTVDNNQSTQLFMLSELVSGAQS